MRLAVLPRRLRRVRKANYCDLCARIQCCCVFGGSRCDWWLCRTVCAGRLPVCIQARRVRAHPACMCPVLPRNRDASVRIFANIGRWYGKSLFMHTAPHHVRSNTSCVHINTLCARAHSACMYGTTLCVRAFCPYVYHAFPCLHCLLACLHQCNRCARALGPCVCLRLNASS